MLNVGAPAAVTLDNLTVGGSAVETFHDSAGIARPAIGGDLHGAIDSSRQVVHELIGMAIIALADKVTNGQLGILIECDERIGIAKLRRITGDHAALFLAHESPDFIALNILDTKAAHAFVKDRFAVLSNLSILKAASLDYGGEFFKQAATRRQGPIGFGGHSQLGKMIGWMPTFRANESRGPGAHAPAKSGRNQRGDSVFRMGKVLSRTTSCGDADDATILGNL